MIGLPTAWWKNWRYVKPFLSDTGTLRTDGRTDRQSDGRTDGFAISILRVSMLTRDNKKNSKFLQGVLPSPSALYIKEAYCMLGIQSLADRRSELCRTLFKQIVNNEFHSLHYLLPAKRDTQLISRLRSTTVYPTFRARTNRFKNSFLPYCMSNYQWQSWHFILLLSVCLCVTVCAIVCFNPAFGCENTTNVMFKRPDDHTLVLAGAR